ncbi:multicopper oxidase family protein [Nocardia terpenica]|uniref:multicopper oxidase family protein n=1 Tax=Nocardia terpenica TaxID=455432 RepID=UPI0019326CFB|nr:multicopper oxidase domain-containing protein [Nocardia terpenica]
MSRLNRSAFLVGLCAAPVTLNICGAIEASAGTAGVEFKRRLPIPELAPSTEEGSVRCFALRVNTGETEIIAETRTLPWGYSRPMLESTIRARRGETVAVTVDNQFVESITVHWHGTRLPARFDSGPHQPIDPGARRQPTWTTDQPAVSLWYQPHLHDGTAKHVYRGLAGMFLVDNDQAPEGLPKTYGVDDIPLIITDVKLTPQGALDESNPADIGLLGDVDAVNGLAATYFEATTRRLRLCVLDASVGRIYSIGCSDNRTFTMIASDGGLLERPVPITRVQLSPGGRAKIVADLTPGQPVTPRAFPIEHWPDETSRRQLGMANTFDVVELRPRAQLRNSPAATGRPGRHPGAGRVRYCLPSNEYSPVSIPPARMAKTPSGSTPQQMDMTGSSSPCAKAVREIWAVIGADPLRPHNFHLRGGQFRVLGINLEPPPPELTLPHDLSREPGHDGQFLVPAPKRILLRTKGSDALRATTPRRVIRRQEEGRIGLRRYAVRPQLDRSLAHADRALLQFPPISMSSVEQIPQPSRSNAVG